jgi:epoxyqueuosine reductase
LWRAKRRGLLRNAAVVLGNRPHPSVLAALERGLNDDEPLVRGACAWALGRDLNDVARSALSKRWKIEIDPQIRAEIEISLNCPVHHQASQSAASSTSNAGCRPGKSSE